MNIHLPAILGFTRYQGFDPSPYPTFFIPHLFGSRIFPSIFTARSLLQDVGTGPHDLFAGHLLLADHWLDGRVARAEGSYGRASGAK